MRPRSGLFVCLAVIGVVTSLVFEPRLHSGFPSMIDDWAAIANAPEQLRDIVLLANPEAQRYRPGFVAWSALQWHTLGAPASFTGPLLWGLARFAVLVVGVTLLSVLLIGPPRNRSFLSDPRWLLTLGVPLAVLTVPGTAVDLARYGPQEPLLVGCMSLGAVILVRSIDRLLVGGRSTPSVAVAVIFGLLVWAFGVLQKESSICALVLVPFLWPTMRSQASRWAQLERTRRMTIGAVAIVTVLPFVPMMVRSGQLASAETRVYGEVAAQQTLATRVGNQLTRADEVLSSPFFLVVALAAIGLVVATLVLRGADWLTVGLLVTAVAFVGFAADSGVVTSRYYLPSITLLALALGRAAASLDARLAATVGALLIATGTAQAVEARERVETWVTVERDQESLVREAASRVAAGCAVFVTGSNVELVQALPVLMPIAGARPRDCRDDQRFAVVVDWIYGPTRSTDAVITSCGPRPRTVWVNRIGRIDLCTTRAS